MIHEAPVLPEVSPSGERNTHLQAITQRTVLRLKGITSSELDPIKQEALVERVYAFADNLDGKVGKLDRETEEERSQRLGWMIPAAALEILGDNGFKKSKARIAWKDELVWEILKEREQKESRSIPGISLRFREPYQGYLDQFSSNRIIIVFENQKGECFNGNTLHVGSNFNKLVQMESVERVHTLLTGYEAMGESLELWWGLSLLREISFLGNDVRNGREDVAFQHLRKRFAQFQQLVKENQSFREQLEIRYIPIEKYHAFSLRAKRNFGIEEFFGAPVQFQPEEVTNTFWEFLKELSGEKSIPGRKACIQVGLRRKSDPDDSSENEYDEDDISPRRSNDRKGQRLKARVRAWY